MKLSKELLRIVKLQKQAAHKELVDDLCCRVTACVKDAATHGQTAVLLSRSKFPELYELNDENRESVTHALRRQLKKNGLYLSLSPALACGNLAATPGEKMLLRLAYGEYLVCLKKTKRREHFL